VATLEQILDALAARVTTELDPVIENLQVVPKLTFNPTPPCIDIFPGDPFFEPIAFDGRYAYYFTVRARATAADHEGGQSLLLSLMDPSSSTSLADAIEGTYSISGTSYDVTVEEGPSAFGIFNDPGSIENRLLGTLWRVRVL